MSNNTKALNYQTDSLTVINRIADALANGSSFDQAIQDIMHAIQNYTNADMLTFLVADQESTFLEMQASVNLVDDVIHQGPISVIDSLSGLTMTRQEIITSADIANDKRIPQNAREALSQHGLQYIISMPIIYQAQAIAVTNLFYQDMPEIPDRAYETLLAIGKLVGSALANTDQNKKIFEKADLELAERENAERILQENETELLAFQEKLNILQDVNFQLAHCTTLAELYEQAIVLGRSHLGFDRIGLLL